MRQIVLLGLVAIVGCGNVDSVESKSARSGIDEETSKQTKTETTETVQPQANHEEPESEPESQSGADFEPDAELADGCLQISRRDAWAPHEDPSGIKISLAGVSLCDEDVTGFEYQVMADGETLGGREWPENLQIENVGELFSLTVDLHNCGYYAGADQVEVLVSNDNGKSTPVQIPLRFVGAENF